MVKELADPEFTANIVANQTQALFQMYKGRGIGTEKAQNVLDAVVLMTPENIHLNSFMYEPIIDMSDASLRKLFSEIDNLCTDKVGVNVAPGQQ